MEKKSIERIALTLFEYSLSGDKQYILDGLLSISNELEGELNENIDINELKNMRILCREISNYLTHVVNEDNEHLQNIQMYLLMLALKRIIEIRKDD